MDAQHSELVVRRGARSGLPTMVAVHSTARGPAIGGCRLKHYPDLNAAIADVLRLSRAMTAKCAAAGVPFGGGKSVIALPPGTRLDPDLRRAAILDHADLIADFDGDYRAGPDIGTGPADMLEFPHAFCAPESAGGSGSSSEPTAIGVRAALRAATGSVAGKQVVLVGLGSVGAYLAESLIRDGAEVTITDIDAEKHLPATRLGAKWVAPEQALTVPADVLIPAAIGGLIDHDTEIAADLVVGPANNQLVTDDVADTLADKGITWIPDFVASAGGIIYTIAREVDRLPHDAALAEVDRIADTVRTILDTGATPLDAAKTLVARRMTEPGHHR